MSTILKNSYDKIAFNLEVEAHAMLGKAAAYKVDRRVCTDTRAEWDSNRWCVWNLYAKMWRWFNLEMSTVAHDLEIINVYKNSALHLQTYHANLKKQLEGDIATVSDKLWKLTGRIEEIDQTRKQVATQNQNVKIASICACIFGGLFAWSPTHLVSLASKVALFVTAAFIYFNWTTGKETSPETWQSIGEEAEKIRCSLFFYDDKMVLLPKPPVGRDSLFPDFIDTNYAFKLPSKAALEAVTYGQLPSPPETQSSTPTGS